MTKKPFALQTRILERAFKGRALEDIFEQYEHAKKCSGFALYVPTKLHIDLYKKWLKGELGVMEAAKEMGLKSSSGVLNRFLRITQLIHSKELTLKK